jgi:small-conductance mechanosensitive channel
VTPADEFTDIRIRLGARDPDDPALEDMLARLQQLHDAVRRENRAVREQLGRLLVVSNDVREALRAELAAVNGLVEAQGRELESDKALIAALRDDLVATQGLSASRADHADALLDAHRQSYTSVVDERREGR